MDELKTLVIAYQNWDNHEVKEQRRRAKTRPTRRVVENGEEEKRIKASVTGV